MSQSSYDELNSDLLAYVGGRRRDSKKESDLLRRLRALPQQERRALLLPLLNLKASGVLALVHRAQLPRSDYLEILKQGLNEVRGASIKYWMEATVPHIGWRKTFSVLRESMATAPRAGAMALYWVPVVCRRKGQSSGSLPTRELAFECIQLIVQYHERGHRVVDDSQLAKFKDILSRHRSSLQWGGMPIDHWIDVNILESSPVSETLRELCGKFPEQSREYLISAVSERLNQLAQINEIGFELESGKDQRPLSKEEGLAKLQFSHTWDFGGGEELIAFFETLSLRQKLSRLWNRTKGKPMDGSSLRRSW